MKSHGLVITLTLGLGLTLILALFVLTSQAAPTARPLLIPADVGNHIWDSTLSDNNLGPIADGELITSTAYITLLDTQQSCVPSPDGLISWWPGDGNATDIADGNDGTLQGGTGFAAGNVGQAFSFDGSDDQVDVGNAANLHVSTDEFTVLAWVRFDVDDLPPIGHDMSIADKMSDIGLNGDGWRLVRQTDVGKFMFCLGGGGFNGCDYHVPTPSTTVLGTTFAQKDVWYHVAGVLSSSEFSIYVNGVLEDSKSRPTFTDSNSTDLLIGANAPEGAHLDGLVDEVALFNRALSAAEIQNIFNAGSTGMCKPRLPSLETTKDANPNPVRAGEQLTYTIRVTNNYTEDLHATITDILPSHVSPTGILTWTPATIISGSVWSQPVVVTVEMGYAGILTNVVQVTTEEGPTGVYTATTLSLAPYLAVSKDAMPNPVQAGSQLTYTIRVTNTGNITLTGLVTDMLPAHVTPTDILTWPLTNLIPGDIWTKTVVVIVEMGYAGPLTNVVKVTTLEGASGIYTATSQAQVTPALLVTKQANPDPVQAGSQLTYTLRLTNTGNIALNGTITDTLPLHVMPTGVLTWPLTNLTPGNAWMQQVVVTVTRGYSGTLTNRVQVTTREGATGEAQIIANAIGYQVYLPIVLK